MLEQMAHSMICVLLPLRIISEANQRGHWSKSADRKALHRKTARCLLRQYAPPTSDEISITLVRIAPRDMDDDNLQSGFKSVRDGVADWLGIDDGDKRLTWVYMQSRGGPSQRGKYMAEVIVSWPVAGLCAAQADQIERGPAC